MSQSMFIVRLADLERGKKHYEWELPLLWLQQAFEGTEASAEGPGKLHFEASVTSRQVLLRGQADAKVTMPCARTLDPVSIDLSAEFFLVLRPAPVGQGSGKAAVGSVTKKQGSAVAVAKTAKAPKQRPSRRPEPELSEDEAAADTYEGDHIELDGFIREFLLLELPMMPLRSDLRSEERPAIHPTPETPEGSASSTAVDPRLRPLAEIASRLRKKTKE